MAVVPFPLGLAVLVENGAPLAARSHPGASYSTRLHCLMVLMITLSSFYRVRNRPVTS
jgi:hypothetical protein